VAIEKRAQLPTLRAVVNLNRSLALEVDLDPRHSPTFQVHDKRQLGLFFRPCRDDVRPPRLMGNGIADRWFPQLALCPSFPASARTVTPPSGRIADEVAPHTRGKPVSTGPAYL